MYKILCVLKALFRIGLNQRLACLNEDHQDLSILPF